VDKDAKPWAGAGWLVVPVVLACGSLCGCAGWWDEVTSHDYKFKDAFKRPPDPMTVLQKDPDNDHRARALRALREPLANGGSQQEQDVVVQTLIQCATNDQQALCRLAAVETLSTFRDPRAGEALKDAFYRAGSFNPETAGIIKCRVLASLGKSGQPSAVELLVKVLREPPVEGSAPEKQQKTDERIAAARALSHFPRDSQVTEALLSVLRSDRDVALRDRAHESLVQVTGKDLPPDGQVWDEYLHRPGSQDAVAEKPGPLNQLIRRVSGRE
jgi:hypothetical protein